MSSIRVAVAATPLSASIEEALPAALAAIEEAGRLGARVVCLPETAIPGHRDQARAVADVSAAAIDEALRLVARAVAVAHLTAIVGIERPTSAGRLIAATVIGPDGSVVGEQAKTQIDPTEERWYVPGSGRRTFTVDGLTFGIAICHEAFRYPEVARSLVLAGAQLVFVPHYVVTDDGSRPERWCDAANPYNEKALVCRALENTVFVAAANIAGPSQGSVTGIVSPDGRLVTSLPYGRVGVVAADIDTTLATRELALRWAPGRSLVARERLDEVGPR